MADYLPEEIIEKILLRLPVKTLIRFTTVCKSWSSKIKASTFVKSHLCTTVDSYNHNDAHLILLSACSKERISEGHHWLHRDSHEFGEYSKLSNPLPPYSKQDVAFVLGTCNGLVCFESYKSSTVIWNPSIHKILKLPSPPACFSRNQYRYCKKHQTHGFGYDSHSNDYKVLRVVSITGDYSRFARFTTMVQVYSLARGSWRTLSASVVPVTLQAGGPEDFVFVNDRLHIRLNVYYDRDGHNQEHLKRGGEKFITYFDLATEVFGEIMIPEALRRDDCIILRYGESLALIKHKQYNPDNPANCGSDIWVMKEYGVAESWTFLYNIAVVKAAIYGFKRCGEVVLEERSSAIQNRFGSLDPKSKQFRVFGTKDCSYYFMGSFVESLVLLDHPKAMSYQ